MQSVIMLSKSLLKVLKCFGNESSLATSRQRPERPIRLCTTIDKKTKKLSFPNEVFFFRWVWAYAYKLQTRNINATDSPF